MKSSRRMRGLALSELAFIMCLLGALALVGALGWMSLTEERRTDRAKGRAVALLQWFDDLAADPAKVDLAQRDQCTPDKVANGSEKTWLACRNALLAEGGPLHGFVNPFDSEYPVFGDKCERKNTATRGIIVVQESLKVPPGQPAAFAPMPPTRPLEKDLGFRVIVCDKGSFPIKVGESKL